MILADVLATEVMKLRRSKVTWLSALGASIGPLAGALFMLILKDPGRAKRLGLIGQKAQLTAGTADWPTLLDMLLQMLGVGGMILIAIVAAYVFGREYAEGTAKNLLALPIRRGWFAAAKLAVTAVWFAALAALMTAETFLAGAAVGLPGFSAELATRTLGSVALVTAGVLLLAPAVAWIALLGRGYFAPLSFGVLTLLLGVIFGATGWGRWVPWSIVPLFAGVAGPRGEQIATGSYVVLVATFAAGTIATILRLRADNTQ